MFASLFYFSKQKAAGLIQETQRPWPAQQPGLDFAHLVSVRVFNLQPDRLVRFDFDDYCQLAEPTPAGA
jgi:hypothetical protein